MNRLIITCRTVVLLTLAAGLANASTVFNFATQTAVSGGAYGNSLSLTVGGVGVTETAWYTSNTSSGTTFQKAGLDSYTGYGLGICNPTQGTGCGSPQHQIDNAGGGVEFVNLHFSTAVSLSSLQLYVYAANGSTGGNANITYYSAATSLSTSTTLGSLGTGTTVNASCSGAACVGVTTTDALSGGSITDLIVAASIPDATSGLKVDDFKLSSLTVGPVSATPEPASFVLIAIGLALIGIASRKSRRA